MCMVIDVNTFHCLFDSNSQEHNEFLPVLKWLYKTPETKIVYGGTKYREELSKLKKYFGILAEFRKISKIAEIDDDCVDRAAESLREQITCLDFDDPHIIAIFISSNCRLFCSKDARADRFIKNNELYPKGHKKPKIYRGQHHIGLLCPQNIVKLTNVVN